MGAPARRPQRHAATRWPRAFGEHNRADQAWLAGLPERLAQLAQRWSLQLDRHFAKIAINYVVRARRADGTPCVLKVSRHVGETQNEIAALRLWNGGGAAHLLEADPDQGALLLEYLKPGTMLSEIARTDDDAATRIAAGLLGELWHPLPAEHGLRSLVSWCGAFERNRDALTRGVDGFPVPLFQRADALRHELLTSTEQPTVLHGDLHHFNILRAQRANWLAIDPKGLAGDRCFDVCQFFRNPRRMSRAVNRRRLDIFCTELGLERDRTKAWCFVHAILDACWSFEDGQPWQAQIAYAEATQHF